MSWSHTPVLVKEILDIFQVKAGDRLLDATAGLGGHMKAYLESTPNTNATGLDADEKAVASVKENLASFGKRAQVHHASYIDLKEYGNEQPFNHILFDLGVGSHQLGDTSRGFSFKSGGDLVMRYGDGSLPPSSQPAIAWLEEKLGHVPDVVDIVQNTSAEELEALIRHYGQERMAGRIAKAIKKHAPIQSAAQLATIIQQAVPSGYEKGRIHPATRTFQAFRIMVNRELEALELGLQAGLDVLAPRGKMAVISFHSLEDKIVKDFFKQSSQQVITKKPITASEEEKASNPRSRSAKLRAMEKVP